MVVFVLNDPRLQSVELLVVLDEVFVEITHPDGQRTRHIGMDARKGKTPFVIGLLLLRKSVDFGIDKGTLVVGAFGIVLAPRRAIDDEQTNGLADLRRGQSDAFGFAERLEHVLDKFFHFGIVGRNLLALFAKHLVPVYDNRINHLLNSI